MTTRVEQIPERNASQLSRAWWCCSHSRVARPWPISTTRSRYSTLLARAFGTGSGAAGLVVTFAQIGYALGLAFLVPLGDLIARRLLVPVVLVVSAVGLPRRPVAPTIGVLTALGLLVGGGSVAAQLSSRWPRPSPMMRSAATCGLGDEWPAAGILLARTCRESSLSFWAGGRSSSWRQQFSTGARPRLAASGYRPKKSALA